MSEELIKCPNCNGSLIVKNNKKECQYCGAEFVIKQESQSVQQRNQNEDSNLSIAERWFELVNVQKSYANDKIWHTLEEILINVNKEYSLLDYFDYFKASATNSMKNLKDKAAFDINRELMSVVKARLKALLSNNEELLYYRDSGIISRGKTGILYTNMRIFFLTKRSTDFIAYSDIKSFQSGKGITTSLNHWIINNEYRLKLNDAGINDVALAIEISYICTGVKNIQERQGNPKYKIKIEFLGN